MWFQCNHYPHILALHIWFARLCFQSNRFEERRPYISEPDGNTRAFPLYQLRSRGIRNDASPGNRSLFSYQYSTRIRAI